jgi:hypothetical protein
VETKLRGDVLHLESKGIVEIAVHSPDYIPEYIIKVSSMQGFYLKQWVPM